MASPGQLDDDKHSHWKATQTLVGFGALVSQRLEVGTQSGHEGPQGTLIGSEMERMEMPRKIHH